MFLGAAFSNVICIGSGRFSTVWGGVFICIPLWVLKDSCGRCSPLLTDGRVQRACAKGLVASCALIFCFLYKPHQWLFSCLVLCHVYTVAKTLSERDGGMHTCITWWTQDVEFSVWMTACLTLLHKVCLEISLFLPKTYARLISYTHVYCWYVGGVLVTEKPHSIGLACVCEKLSRTLKKAVLFHFYANKITFLLYMKMQSKIQWGCLAGS